MSFLFSVFRDQFKRLPQTELSYGHKGYKYEFNLKSIQADHHVCLYALLFYHDKEYWCRSPPLFLRFQLSFEN